MRGKELLIARHFDDARITPAYAGKSEIHSVFVIAVVGSPPRMRGKVSVEMLHNLHAGITPAYAGKSLARIEF